MKFELNPNILLKKMDEYKQIVQKENIESSTKILKALKDTIDAYNSIRELSVQEFNEFGQIIRAATLISYIAGK